MRDYTRYSYQYLSGIRCDSAESDVEYLAIELDRVVAERDALLAACEAILQCEDADSNQFADAILDVSYSVKLAREGRPA